MAARMAVQYSLRQLLPSIVFPVICFTPIYLDWSHTQKWKREQRLKTEILERVQNEKLSD
jgi:hypothetical protein